MSVNVGSGGYSHCTQLVLLVRLISFKLMVAEWDRTVVV